MVLPDPARPGSDRDLLVWLPGSVAADDEDEATQRGALAALAAVASDRCYERVLPGRYRGLWADLSKQVGGAADMVSRR